MRSRIRQGTPTKRKAQAPGSVSLARALSKLGYTSRSLAAGLIEGGSVNVNGENVTNPSRRVDLVRDRIEVAGNDVRQKAFTYLALYKPAGYVTTRSDERGRKTVYDLLPATGEWLFPVGRLDMDSEGLLIMTNDHRLGEELTNPDSKVTKEYVAFLDRPLAEDHIAAMRTGLEIKNEILLPAKVERIEKAGAFAYLITIREGKNRQIRRMCEHFGIEVVRLTRTKIGGYELGTMEQGAWKKLSPEDVASLRGKPQPSELRNPNRHRQSFS